MSAEGPTSDVGGSKTFDELAGGYSMPSSSPSGYNGPEDGGFTGVPGKLPAQPAATGYTNVGHDGSFNGMNREQWRDAWMSQGASSRCGTLVHPRELLAPRESGVRGSRARG
jgi:hypothetical protein